MWYFIISLIFIALILVSCVKKVEKVKEDIIKENSPYEIKAFFCARDDCGEILTKLIQQSKKSVHCAVFELDLPKIIKALTEKSKKIDVKIVMDGTNVKDLKNVSFVRYDNNSWAYMHNKFCIFDNYTVMTGSFNPTEKGAYYNNNNMVILYSKYLAINYEDEFQELWNLRFGNGEKVKYPLIYLNKTRIEPYFCPEDYCKSMLHKKLRKANQSIYFMTFSFTHDLITRVILENFNEGVKVKGVFENLQASDSAYDVLRLERVNVIKDKNKYNMHHKVFIIDEKTIVTGSFNPSGHADEDNDENIIIIEDRKLAKKFMDEFNFVWNFDYDLITKKEKASDIIISEVMYNPSGADTGKEYVVLFNPTAKNININYYRLDDTKSMQVLSGTIKSKSSKKIIPKNSLKNSNGILILRNRVQEQLDYIAWDGIWNLEAIEGKSLKRTKFSYVNRIEEWA